MSITQVGKAMATAAIALWAISLTSCGVRSKQPLSDPDASRPDPALYGTWMVKDKDKKKVEDAIVFIGKAAESRHGKVPAGIMRAAAVGFDKESVERPMEFTFFVTQLGQEKYMNWFETPEVFKADARDKAAIKVYWLFKYRVTEDKLEIWSGNESAVQEAIEKGKIEGKITKRSFGSAAQLTDTTANLAEFFEKGGGRTIFSGENLKVLVLVRRSNP